MVGRLKDGVRPSPIFIPVQWTCNACGRKGLGWCFRAQLPRAQDSAPSQPDGNQTRGRQRQQPFPGQPPVSQSAPVRAPRRPAPKPAPKLRPGLAVPDQPAPVDCPTQMRSLRSCWLRPAWASRMHWCKQVKSSFPPTPAGRGLIHL